jgi:predicted dehydrogenase
MLRVGIVGLGFMGMVHYLSYHKLSGVKVVAICESDEKRRAGDWRSIKGNFGPPGEIVDLAGISIYEDIGQIVDDPNVDLIDVTLPPALHADTCIRALTAAAHDRLLMVGHVLPYFPEYQWALNMIRSGEYGQVRAGSFKRVIANPQWLAHYWDPTQVGGPMLDLHVHDAHFIRLLFGLPRGVSTWGSQRNGLAEHWHTQFDYGLQGPTVHCIGGTIEQQGRSFNQGFEIQLEQATLCFEFAVIGDQGIYLCPPTLLKNDGTMDRPQLPGGDPMDAFAAELAEVVRACSENSVSDVLNASLAQDAIRLCQKESESLANRGYVPL